MATASLPPLLLQRLKRRGILAEKKEEEEEVFAESYDPEDETKSDAAKEKFRGGAPGCPNKHIPFHVCSDFCFDHWQEGYPESRLSERYLEQRRKMLRNYPLPEGWTEVYDAGVRRHYYWNQGTDEVCWLSPKHPKAVISEAAPKIAREMWNLGGRGLTALGVGEEDGTMDERRRGGGRGGGGRGAGEDDRRQENRERGGKRGRDRRKEYEDRMALAKRSRGDDEDSEEEDKAIEELSERDKLRRARRKGIDPMDPSAYGEAGEGGWNAGLREDQEVKTGADVTASGPLFQQRPYPAPGAILRRQHPDKYPPQ